MASILSRPQWVNVWKNKLQDRKSWYMLYFASRSRTLFDIEAQMERNPSPIVPSAFNFWEYSTQVTKSKYYEVLLHDQCTLMIMWLLYELSINEILYIYGTDERIWNGTSEETSAKSKQNNIWCYCYVKTLWCTLFVEHFPWLHFSYLRVSK